MKLCFVIFSVLLFIKYSNCYTKVWLYNSDISDPQNWQNGMLQKNCDGLIFAEKNSAVVTIEQVKVKRITLPRSGTLRFLSGSSIVFDENSRENLNCVKLKPLEQRVSWDFNGWNNTDDPDNPAIPYSERPPSKFDDIILPNKLHSNVKFGGEELKSVTIGRGKSQTTFVKYDNPARGFLDDELSLRNYNFIITDKQCEDVTGCMRGISSVWSWVYCKYLPKDNVIDCRDPIRPDGFCNLPKCGASIMIEVLKPGFRLDKINKKLKEYSSYTHAGKISAYLPHIQIFFTEKEFTGDSIVEATEFYNQLQEGFLDDELSLRNYNFIITDKQCEDVTGCMRGISSVWSWVYCKYLPKDNVIDCRDPIRPDGFCNLPKCGASIMIEVLKPGFRLDKINKKLKEYSSYTHAGKISAYLPHIQIFFTEKEFTGDSIVEATEFYNQLQEDPSYFCGNVKLQTSGSPLHRQSAQVKNALSITFGTLLAVIIMFGLLFLIYSPTVGNLNIRNRLLGSRPLSTYILRYDNIEDRGYIVDGQSIAGSVPNLNRSFENPMFEHTSSSMSTSNETIASVKMESSRDENQEEIDANVEEAEEISDIVMQQQKDDVLLEDL